MAKKAVSIEDTVPATVIAGPIEEYCTKPQYDSDGVQASSGIGVDGREYPDPVPMSAPVGLSRSDGLNEFIRSVIRNELSNRAAAEEFETFDEADDFEIEDDPLDRLTEYEKVFEPPAKSPPPEASVVSTPVASGDGKSVASSGSISDKVEDKTTAVDSVK